METILKKAIDAVQFSQLAYSKFLSANDTKATGGHQSGYLISKSAWKMFLKKEPQRGENIKIDITIKWQLDFETNSVFTYYGSAKNEFRITNFGRKFPFREDNNVGDLFILVKKSDFYFEAFILSRDEDIDDFFSELNMSSVNTNQIIPTQFERSDKYGLHNCFLQFIKSLALDFPSTFELASSARNCYINTFKTTSKMIISQPDSEILNWLNAEFSLFKLIETNRYSKIIQTPFKSVEELIETANTILNRRKSRAGKSLEHHLLEIFKISKLNFETQAKTEGNKKPDFLFPGSSAYFDSRFKNRELFMLASKTTCKDRWRQILNEADKIKTKHLFTLQQGISTNQLEEMYKYNVCLVVPQPFITSFPKKFKDKILSLKGFIDLVTKNQQ
jgi:hypothetical protein